MAWVLAIAMAYAPVGWAASIKVDIQGVDEDEKKNILIFLSIEQQRQQVGITEGRVRSLHARAPREIRAALEPFGIYRPDIQSELEQDGNDWIARYIIDPGERLRVTELDLRVSDEAADDPEFQRLIAKFPIKEGDVAIHARYENGKRALLNLGVERGYFDARLTQHHLEIDLDNYQARVVLHYESGPRYHFGPVSFEGETELDPQILRRMVPFTPGEPFTTTGILKLQTALSDSDYFQQVDVQPRRDLADGLRVPVEVKFSMRDKNKYTLGLGFGTDTGVRGKLGWERRLINAAGHRFSTELSASEIRSGINARYTIPVGNPVTDQVAFTAGYVDDHPETSDSQTATIGASYSRTRDEWRETYSINYHRERFIVADDVGRSTLLVPGANWLRLRTEDRIYTRRGTRLQFDLRGTAEAIGSDVSFLQMRVGGKAIYPAGQRGRWILRADGGATAVSSFADLPASFRFFAGGDLSVRGYDYNTIGSIDANNKVVGGKYLAVASAEYEHDLVGKWSAAVFYDVGNAFNDLSTEQYKHGVGLGIRWLSPVGLIRLDLANAVSEDDRPWRVHLVIGPDL